MTQIFGGKKFEALFRNAAGLDMDKSDLKRLYEVVNQKMHDMLEMGVVTAQANGRDVIQFYDLPITMAFKEQLREVREYDETLNLEPILEQLATLPKLKLDYSSEVENALPELTGAITVALAKMFKAVNPELKNPKPQDWEKVISVFNILI
ncbi:protein of unknown function DUF1931 [Desulfonatronospira thiodismutans ASO3-1]|uniref:DUF1931 family protein n=2 Tax=Desulfonatronospira TaxID=488937 RepID=D6SJR9_9BACT|nr:DUF1931 family protein [Desulfonatronospira thiodismutans]EFI36122.1 protein of unknown function DUF1931 [Desulfonatronospira thiodismutans ASO3-1]